MRLHLRFAGLAATLALASGGACSSSEDPAPGPSKAPGEGAPIVPPADLVPGAVRGFLVEANGAVKLAASAKAGTGLSGATIVARRHDGAELGRATTDADGGFEIRGLPPRLVRLEGFRGAASPVPDATLEITVVPAVTIAAAKAYPVSRQRSIALAMEGVPDTALVAGTMNPLPQGVAAYARSGPNGPPTEYLRVLPADEWVFWIDRTPNALYRHEVEYVFVDAETEAVERVTSIDRAMFNHGGLWGSRDDLFVTTPPYWTVDPPPDDATFQQTAEFVQLPRLATDDAGPDSREAFPPDEGYDPTFLERVEDLSPLAEPASKRVDGTTPRHHFNNRDGEGVFVVLIRGGSESVFYQDMNRMAMSFWTGIDDDDVPLANIAKMDFTARPPLPYTATGLANEDSAARAAAMKAALGRAVLHFEPRIEARLQEGLHSTLFVYATGHGGGGEIAVEFENDDSGVWGFGADELPVTETRACRVRVILNSCESGKLKDQLAQRFQGTEHDVTLFASTAPNENGLGTPAFFTFVPIVNVFRQGGSQFTTVFSSLMWLEDGDIRHGRGSDVWFDSDEGLRLHGDLRNLAGHPPPPFVRPSHPSWCFPTGSADAASVGDGSATSTGADGQGGGAGAGGAGGAAGAGGDGGDGGASACDDDGACQLPDESCDCFDCLEEEACGAGCDPFTLGNMSVGDGFFEGPISQVGGAPSDYIQGFGFADVAEGTYELTAPANLTDCSPCVQTATDDYSIFSAATSGRLVVTSSSPLQATMSNVVFRKRSVDQDNNLTIDPGGPCFFLQSGTIP